MNPKVFVSRIIPDAGLELVKANCNAEIWPGRLPPAYDLLVEKVRGVAGLLCTLNDRIDGPLMDAAGPQLKVISQMAVGVDNIDLAAAAQRGIPVGHTPGVLTEATADLAFTLLLAAARRLTEGLAYIREGRWDTWEPMALLGADLNGATLGIVGLGRIGTAVARRASGFNMRIIAHDTPATAEHAASVDAPLIEFDALLRASDFISLHVPLTDETRHLIDARALAQMKPTAILVNTSRGPVVDQQALYEALKNGRIAAAALDVTDPEPLPLDDPILALPNALIMPHIGSASKWTRSEMARIAAENLIAGVTGKRLAHQFG